VTKSAWDEKVAEAKQISTPANEHGVSMRARFERKDESLHIRVTSKDGRSIDYIARANQDGTLSVDQAPEPDQPVQDPDPNSGT
jgi:hypothetical protein